jgi:4-hydroxybenzoate polyprenyltransferase
MRDTDGRGAGVPEDMEEFAAGLDAADRVHSSTRWTGIVLSWIRLSRIKQWTKNLFVLAPLFFAGELFHFDKVRAEFGAFLAFCLVSSSVYVVNDIVDREKDRMHPKKRFRPLAVGQITPVQAGVFGLLLLVAGLGLGFAVSFWTGVLLAAYLIMNLFYSFWLKQLVIVDVMTIALGFVLRVTAGSSAIRVTPSPWLLVCTFLLAIFLGLCKRRNEMWVLEKNAVQHRKILEEYQGQFLDQLIVVACASTILGYSLYTFNAVDAPWLMLGIPFVIYSMFRYLFLVYKKDLGDSPELILLEDKPFIVSGVLWILVNAAVLYFKG